MKILSIGNSFSQDAHAYLHKLGFAQGLDVDAYNLYIGGCSLETHWNNVQENNAFYELEANGIPTGEKISIDAALKKENWDVITLQQVSGFSGVSESYDPYLKSLADFVKENCPNAKIVFHATWAYETDSEHGDFQKYNNNQKEMYERIIAVTTAKAKKINAEIIPSGKVIQYLRENVAEFDYKNGGASLCRDGFHLSLDYGRFAAAAAWVRFLMNKPLNICEFEGLEKVKTEKIIEAANTVFENL